MLTNWYKIKHRLTSNHVLRTYIVHIIDYNIINYFIYVCVEIALTKYLLLLCM